MECKRIGRHAYVLVPALPLAGFANFSKALYILASYFTYTSATGIKRVGFDIS